MQTCKGISARNKVFVKQERRRAAWLNSNTITLVLNQCLVRVLRFDYRVVNPAVPWLYSVSSFSVPVSALNPALHFSGILISSRIGFTTQLTRYHIIMNSQEFREAAASTIDQSMLKYPLSSNIH
jgi:hypothetical protein